MENEFDKHVKDRWLRLYQNDINLYHERRELEVFKIKIFRLLYIYSQLY